MRSTSFPFLLLRLGTETAQWVLGYILSLHREAFSGPTMSVRQRTMIASWSGISIRRICRGSSGSSIRNAGMNPTVTRIGARDWKTKRMADQVRYQLGNGLARKRLFPVGCGNECKQTLPLPRTNRKNKLTRSAVNQIPVGLSPPYTESKEQNNLSSSSILTSSSVSRKASITGWCSGTLGIWRWAASSERGR